MAVSATAELSSCPNWNDIWHASCKKRGCPFCGPRWARDWRRNMEVNLRAYGGPVVMFAVTAPGEDRLPWDREACAGRRPHRCQGPAGCRVQRRAAREWADTATQRWAWLRDAARVATVREMQRRGHGRVAPTLLERVWEPQKRGVPHLHVVLGIGTPVERLAATIFRDELERLAPAYDFGYVGRKLTPMTAADAARYLSSYLTGRNAKRKSSIRENIADPIMPLSLIWLTPKLTRVTGVTMRLLRRARHLWAWLDGMCDVGPAWKGMVDVVRTAIAYRRLYHRKVAPDEDAEADLLAWARRVDAKIDLLRPYQQEDHRADFPLFARALVVAPTPRRQELAAAA